MENKYYKILIEESPVGFAYLRVISREMGIPCDYEFLEANPAFEKLTGLKASDIIGRNVSDIFPDIKKDDFDWIRSFGEVALNGCTKEYEQYSKPLGKRYKVTVHSPEKGYFITHFIDVTKEREQMQELDNFFRINLDLLPNFCMKTK